MSPTHYFANKAVLITGASSGIGKSLALQIADHAQTVYICGRNKTVLEAMAKKTKNLKPLVFDITDKAMLQAAIKTIDKVDILISNAGTCEYVDYPEFKSDMFERVMKTNFMGTVYLLEALLPTLLKSNSPHFVAISSSVSFLPLPRAEAYGASKAALDYLIDTLKISMQHEKVQFTTIHPGFIKTPLTDKNDFPMPHIIGSEEAADIMLKGIADQKEYLHFPKKLTMMFKIIGLLPNFIKFSLLKRKFRQ